MFSPLVPARPAHLGRGVDVASVVTDLQGAQHRCQDGGQERGCQMALCSDSAVVSDIYSSTL